MASEFINDIQRRGASIVSLQRSEKQARDWFFREAQKVTHLDPLTIMNPEEQIYKAKVLPGQMFLFMYDAKHKATLPYWDRFPLVFPFHLERDRFLGINLHYLPLELRVKLMDALYEVSFSNQYSTEQRLRINYDILKSASKFKYAKPCIKEYLYNNVRSRFYLIKFDEWSTVAYLPLQRFVGPNKANVYSDSRKIIRSGRQGNNS